MGLFDKFSDTIFLKETNDLENKLLSLNKLRKEYPNNELLNEEYFIVKKGLEGENEIAYQLKKCNIGLYVLRDVFLRYEDLTAQIDFVIFSRNNCYFIECKNLYGNITVNEKGEFIREYTYNGKKLKKGMYSPLRQVEAQREVYKKIWNKSTNKLLRLIAENNFKNLYRVLVVVANGENILNAKYAPKDVKYKVIKAENLIRHIENDLRASDKTTWSNQSQMKKWADHFLSLNESKEIDYYEYYKNKFNLENKTKSDYINNIENDLLLKERLIVLRKTIANERNIPAYYVFNNDELEAIIKLKPKTIEELKKVLPLIKVNTHGKKIIDCINNFNSKTYF